MVENVGRLVVNVGEGEERVGTFNCIPKTLFPLP